jgi:hypothetical protein
MAEFLQREKVKHATKTNAILQNALPPLWSFAGFFPRWSLERGLHVGFRSLIA